MGQERDRDFWGYYGNEQCPILFTVDRIPPYELVALIKAHVAISEAVVAVDPDVIVLPERGAGPTGWMLEELMATAGTPPFSFQLPIGTYTDTSSGESQGLSHRSQVSLVDQSIKLLFSMQPGTRRILLIDEVQGGGTIVNHAKWVYKALVRDGRLSVLHVLGIEDTRHQLSMKQRAPGYRRLMEGEYEGILAQAVQAPLSLMDRQQVLNRILFDDKPSEKQVHFPHILHNTRAIYLMQLLVEAYRQPEFFQWAVETVKGSTLPQKGLSITERDIVFSFAEKILRLCDELPKPSYDLNVHRFVSWLTEFTQFAMHFPIEQG